LKVLRLALVEDLQQSGICLGIKSNISLKPFLKLAERFKNFVIAQIRVDLAESPGKVANLPL
jgi:hypothetical protein